MANLGDKTLTALTEADHFWRDAAYVDKARSLTMGRVLNEYGIFSLSQIAKIIRMNSRYVYEELERNNTKPGGRFEPQTLTTLVRIRQALVLEERVPLALIRLAIEGGTSYSCLCRLTGLPYSTYYVEASKFQSKVDNPPPKNLKFAKHKVTPEIRADVLKMRERDWTHMEIAKATGVSRTTVTRILQEAA